jgi:hypothetical protein
VTYGFGGGLGEWIWLDFQPIWIEDYLLCGFEISEFTRDFGVELVLRYKISSSRLGRCGTTYNNDAIAALIRALITHMTGWRKSLVINVTCKEVVLLKLVLYRPSYVVRKRELEHVFVSSSRDGVRTLEQSLADFTKGRITCVGASAHDVSCKDPAAVSILPETFTILADGCQETYAYFVRTSPFKLETIRYFSACLNLYSSSSPDDNRRYILAFAAVKDDLSRNQLALTEYTSFL